VSVRVLFIDDDTDFLRTAGAYFERVGHEVHRAADGGQGLALFDRVEPHVTVVDFRMPGMNGMEVLERVRRKQGIVIMLTGHGEIETAVEAMRLGAENFIQKPVDMGHLLQAVEKAAEKATLRREVVTLRRLVPSRRKRVMQMVVTAALIFVAVVIGLAIGREQAPEAPPIPIPIEEGT